MFVGTIKLGKNIKGYLDKGLVEVHNIQNRHDELVAEMLRRGYKHNSPILFASGVISGKIDSSQNRLELHNRCPKCRQFGS
jgi:hypothetical protein